MKKLLTFLTAILFISTVYGQPEPANYKVVINQFKTFYNTNKPDSIYKIFGPEMRNALTQEQFKATATQLKAQLGGLNQAIFMAYTAPVATYDAAFQNGSLVLSLSLNSTNQIIGLLLKPAEVKTAPTVPTAIDDPNLTESPILLKVFAGNIAGTLTMPKNAGGKVPVVLIIAGSGPTDRDGNNPGGVNSNTYKMIAAALGKNGIATLRYDKRLVGQSVSTTKEKDLRFGDYVDDAIALIGMLHNDPRFNKVIVMGHSEGSLIGMLAADDQPVNAYISLAGAAERGDKLITDQLKSKPQFIQDAFKVITDSLKKRKFTDKVDPALYSLARPAIQPYLLSWFEHEPKTDIKKLKIPILIVQGTTDLQVPAVEGEKLKKAKSDAVLLMIPGMNHVLKEAPAEREANLATYSNPTLPVKPELITGIVAFIGKLK